MSLAAPAGAALAPARSAPDFDELFDARGEPRPHYRRVFARLAALPPDAVARCERLRDEVLRRRGVTFAAYGDPLAGERTWPLDLVPRLIPADEWRAIERGLVQRVTALNRFLDDVYTGERAALEDGIVPRWLVHSSEGFVREACGIRVPPGARCLVSGIDLVRDSDGRYRVLEDNLRTPSGASYVLENRAALGRVLPGLFEGERVRSVSRYPAALHEALCSAAPPAAGSSPRVVLLTPGVHNPAYFEHAWLARRMGIELVEGRDLVVDEAVVYLRTTRGLERVDVIYRRVNDEFLDPTCLRADSVLGVAGLLAAVRAGNVTLANAIGNGLADDKAVYPYVPALIRYYLGEEPILANVPTYLPWDPDQRVAALERLDRLVVKPVGGAGGVGIVIGPLASDEELALAKKRIEQDPRGFIVQETVRLSTHPCRVGATFEPRRIDLRPFALGGRRIEVLPGGLTRVALRPGSFVVNSSQGGGSKDTWVLADEVA